MDYLQESGASIHRRRRRRRAVVTLTLVTLLLLGTFLYAAAFVRGWVQTTAPSPLANPNCSGAVSARAVTPRMVSINVYNTTNREGLAASVAESLQAQGFNVTKVGNDPLSLTVQGVGEIRRGPSGAAGGALAATRLAGAKVVPDERADDTVDIVLGNKFKALSVPPKVVRSKVAKPTPIC